MERQKVEERNALNDKLKAAANLRDENIKRILNRLREHVSYSLSPKKGFFSFLYSSCLQNFIFKLIITRSNFVQ
jgi:hypothetical protein